MLQLNGLSGKRESQESVEITPRVRVLNTNGAIRLNNAAIGVLGIEAVGYVAVANAGDTVYIGAGKAHTQEKDEKGELVRTGAGKIKTLGDGYGSKGKESTHAKPHLTFSAAASYAILRKDSGKDDFKGTLVYELGEGVEAAIKTDNEIYPEHVTVMYPLILKEVKENEEDEDEVVKEEVSEEELENQEKEAEDTDAPQNTKEASDEASDEDWD